MILLPRAVRVYVATQPVNLRKTYDGLSNVSLRSLVQIAVTVWNAVVVDDFHGTQHVAETRKHIAKGLPPEGRDLMLSIYDSFVQVKREDFADDPRMVASFEVLVDGPEQIRLRAAATVLPPKP
ncbi:MAG: hypothetical protein JST54_12905 [Deltaproteobacteria bacterium]|nr:hypothetical protein [Deltaproteobacteria bacterium]